MCYLVLALPSSGFGREWFDTPEILDLFRREIGKDDDVLIVDPLRADARTRHLQPGVYWRIPRDENGQRRFDIRLRQRTRAGRFVGQRQPVDLVGFGYFYFVDFAAYDWEEVSLSALQRRLPGAVDMFLNQTRAAIERGDRANA